MIISLIVAASTNNAIGKNNQLLWHLPNDLKFFKNTTWGMPVIMGRKTFESVNKPLPGRINIVITRQQNWQAAGVIVAADLQDAVQKATATNCKEAFVIGGGEIYAAALPIANNIYLTRVHTTIEGDTFFPTLSTNEWTLIAAEDRLIDEKHLYNYTFETWQRIITTPNNSIV
jgi:dihydrofolate reductase